MDSVPSPQSFIFSDDYICQWDSCLKNFDDAEMLYEHLRDDHVGRKAHHNLCLTCRWDKCSVPTFAKRDHITSHLRVHVASKPYHCDICRKGFKRPQDLKKHEKTHQDGDGVVPSLGGMPAHLQPNSNDQNYQPLTPPSYLDRSPSIASSTLSAHSPYSMPLSPASMADSNESWTNPGHSSPFPPHSDLFSTPDLVDNSNGQFGRPTVDVSGAYYGVFPNPGYENMISPVSAKRSRDGFDEVLTDTLGSFALEAKKKRLDPSYNEDMMGRLNALSAILEVNPLTPDRLLTSLPDVNDWSQFNQFNQFCSTLFEDVSGEVFQPQTFETLFPEQKQSPMALDANFAGVVPNYNPGLANNNNMNYNNGGNLNGVGYPNTSVSSTGESIYSNLLPEDPFVVGATVPSVPYGTAGLPWEIPASGPASRPGVVKAMPFQNSVQQSTNPYQPHTVTMNTARNSNISARSHNISPTIKTENEETFVPTVVVKVERKYTDMATQTKAKQERLAAEGGMMMRMKPTAEKKAPRSAYEGMDPELVLLNAPAVPNAPLPEIETEDVEDDQDQDQENTAQSEESDSAQSSATPTSSSKFGGLIQKAKARQAAAAAAAAAASEPLDPLEAMTRQLAQTHMEEPQGKVIFHPPTTKPVTEGDMDRQIRAAKARALCSEDPVRKQHAEVVLGLLKSIDSLMADHRQKVAEWTAQQHKQQAGGARRTPAPTPAVSGYPRAGGAHVQNQGQIRTVSSYLPRRTPHQPSPLHQDQTLSDPDYSQLRSSLSSSSSNSHSHSNNDDRSLSNGHSGAESSVLYPTSNLQVPVQDDEEPFELSEEERRFIEEDNAKTAAEKAAASGHPYIYA
ncbi:hypothetical protein BGZ96_007171 [Linnemannia gamsii]|uniref:C2H2-type domain-containing protein n=1 Tax=Linnemannia gamsii TaxID=64522 RepID=A0ABQ7K1P0_9FUNG|nr:hypothetical protein BGZ96_007171 [Linnemannia gamsii]